MTFPCVQADFFFLFVDTATLPLLDTFSGKRHAKHGIFSGKITVRYLVRVQAQVYDVFINL